MPLGSTPSGIFYWRIVAACKLHVYNVISESDIACDIMNAKHLAKIKKTLLAMQRSPRGHKSLEFEGLARALGRERDSRGKEPTYVRRQPPAFARPLSIPDHKTDVKVGTAASIIDALLSDVTEWEKYLQGVEHVSKK